MASQTVLLLFWLLHLIFLALGAINPNRPALWIDREGQVVYLSPLVFEHRGSVSDWSRQKSHMIAVDYRVNVTRSSSSFSPSFTLDVLDCDYNTLLERMAAAQSSG
jgi:hypothetical protein